MVIDKEIEKIKDAVGSLVYDKTALRKAYQYYHGYRDAEQFRHLEDMAYAEYICYDRFF